MDNRSDPFDALVERLRFFEEIGAEFLAAPARGTSRPAPMTAPGHRPAGGLSSPPDDGGPVGPRLPSTARDLEAVAAEVRACRKCPLAAGRTLAVPGEGNPGASLLFVGEGPGHDEDVQGRPFVGRAGQLLTRIIKAMGFERSEVFIANIVKCRPPENRVPHRDEVTACSPFLLEQIAALRPRVIVTLGKTSTDFFLPSGRPMSALRGTFQEWSGIPIMPTFHPSYLVRNEGNKDIKRLVWEDMQKVMALLAGT